MAEKYVRLKDPDGSFYDPETGFHVVRDEIVELTMPIGQLTAAKLAGRGLIESDPPAEGDAKSDSLDPAGTGDAAGPSSEAEPGSEDEKADDGGTGNPASAKKKRTKK